MKKTLLAVCASMSLVATSVVFAQTPDQNSDNTMPQHASTDMKSPMNGDMPHDGKPGMPPHHDWHGPMHRGPHKPFNMEQREKEMWSKVDINHDGKIDRAEFLAQASHQFDMIDQGDKGYLVPEDFKAYGEKMRAMHMHDMDQHHMPPHSMNGPNGMHPPMSQDGKPGMPPKNNADMPPPPPDGNNNQ